ncbi:MAG TPA: hypothetical protein DEA80_19280 [Afipia sp.]|uniref:hypothetical protein n=1 Tax=unclassified Afipia TaxID=2642050 RepID=UPI00046496C1|nr:MULTISPECIES: hypothetical protein [unclassified Afipia]MAH70811.1 hypothetical protein [Afipia sp.]OUX60273.1 MAG: hypothetical protein CBB64_16405 [Afipia sp. TMED4]HAO39079.1 hypothetical protein [Afipia sp.]HAP12529.1 hypothetical protein [Afipia sp.]HAP45730.1 hypothetical protein [Afipia sp.]
MPNTRDRVPAHTSIRINEQIQRDIAIRVRHYAHHLDEIPERLHALAREWDIERAIEANASVLAFVGVTLASRDRRWLALPALVTGFLFQHAIHGRCPPVPILRRLGFRTSYEIEQERQALKALRGDFENVTTSADRAGEALRATRPRE